MQLALHSIAATPFMGWLSACTRATPSQRIVPTQSPFKTVDKGATLVLQKPAGQTIHCIAGSVWITHDGDTKDVVLEAGQSYTSARTSRLLAYGLEAARVTVA